MIILFPVGEDVIATAPAVDQPARHRAPAGRGAGAREPTRCAVTSSPSKGSARGAPCGTDVPRILGPCAGAVGARPPHPPWSPPSWNSSGAPEPPRGHQAADHGAPSPPATGRRWRRPAPRNSFSRTKLGLTPSHQAGGWSGEGHCRVLRGFPESISRVTRSKSPRPVPLHLWLMAR